MLQHRSKFPLSTPGDCLSKPGIIKMRLLEIFSGTRSVSKVAKSLGWETVSLDMDPKYNPDLRMDILNFNETQYPRDYFDFVWSSPDCRASSSARTTATIDRETAMELSDRLLVKTINIIQYVGAPYCVENQNNSLMWKRRVSRDLFLNCCVTSYCRFGTMYRKNTKLANNFGLDLPKCPGMGHCPAMIGKQHREHSQKGGGGCEPRYKTTDELHIIPEGLLLEIFKQLPIPAEGGR